MVQHAQERIARNDQEPRTGEGRMWLLQLGLGRTCTACSLSCEVAIETLDGMPTGITRFANAKSLPADTVIQIDIANGQLPKMRLKE